MKLDAKKKKAILVGVIVVGLLLLLYWVRGKNSLPPIIEDQPEDTGAFDYGNYNMPGVVGGSQFDFGDIVTIHNGSGGTLDTDALANKICGCINPCSSSNRVADQYAFAGAFWQYSYAPPTPPPTYSPPSGNVGYTSIINVGEPRGEYTYWNRGW